MLGACLCCVPVLVAGAFAWRLGKRTFTPPGWHGRDLALEVPRGKRLLVTGPNGAGKTALFRATAGAWEWGQGRIVRPPRERVVFLPQRPFLTPGTLRDQLAIDREGGPGDDRIRDLLRDLKLEAVLGRVAGLDDEHDWPGTLSLGEQQLLGFARLLAAPHFAFLDHATSALGERDRQNAYQRLHQSTISYISVGDRHPILMKYHDTLLELQEDGAWRVTAIGGAGENGDGEGSGFS